MQATDKTEFAALIADALAFYRQSASAFALSVWWQACQGFDLEQVRKALTAHAMDPERGKFAPMPSDMVRVLRGTQTDRSLLAWGKVLDAIHGVGAYQSVVFDDAAIHCAIEDMGGWPAICRSQTDELPHLQRRFCELHRAYAVRPDHPFPARLIGDFEAANRHAGKDVAPPVLVGDAARAQAVMLGGAAGNKTPMVALAASAVQVSA